MSDSPWSRPSFVCYWGSNVAGNFGFAMMSVAVAWQVYAITGRAFDLGLIGLVQFIPSVLLALPAGHFADRHERRRIVVATNVAVTIAIGLLAVLTWNGHIHEFGILALVGAMGVALAFEWPASASLLPALVPNAILPRAMALSSAGNRVAGILGPAAGGLLYIAGPDVVYAVACVLFAIATVLMARARYEYVEPLREEVTLRTIFAGVSFIRRNRDVLGVISLDLFAVLLGGATALLPIYANDVLHTGPIGLGVMRAAPSVGALAMSLYLAHRTLDSRVGMKMFAAVALFGVATLVFAWSTTLWLSVSALFVLGASDMVSVVIRSSLVQLDTPDAMRGRVNAVNSIFINTSNQLGEFESGTLAALVGAVPAAAIGGIGTLVVVGLWMAMFPTLRRRENLQSSPPT